MWKTIANLVGFQAVWLACVGGAGMGYWWAGLPVLALYAAFHFSVTPWRKADAVLVLLALLLGGAMDTAMLRLGLLQFAQPVPSTEIAPIWIFALWFGFALTLNHSMAFFKSRPIASAVFGLLGGPLAYWVAKDVWHAVSFGSDADMVYLSLAVGWALMCPLLMALSSYVLRRFAEHANTVEPRPTR
jgi:Protein of unknown function (DUF2878)